ncbi:uncharacterized protein LOC135608899 [Musa acuminata AAA Group]|uniref:uncharacterized protein LOC135608899 n=1 Tax=Musa acuminata AAA Group TaxID=214697 RepID=UPI0031CFE41B
MKSLRFFAMGWIAGAVLAFFIPSSISISIAAGSASTDEGGTTAMPMHGGRVKTVITHRKLEVNSYIAGAIRTTKDSTSMNVEDYPSFDPAPSSKATIKTGPIEHGIPLMPYIPRPTPPGHRKHGGSP